MIDIKELRPGNYVVAHVAGCSQFDLTIIKIDVIEGDYVSAFIDYPDSSSLEDESIRHGALYPVPIGKRWKMLLKPHCEYPFNLKHVHELQNWYFWTHNKTEMDTSLVPMSDGSNVHLDSLDKLLEDLPEDVRQLTLTRVLA